MRSKLLLLLLIICVPVQAADRITLSANERMEVGRMLTRITAREVAGGSVKIDRLQASRGRVRIYASAGLSYYPFREQNVQAIYDSVRAAMPAALRKAKLELYTDGRLIEELIPLALRRSVNRRKIRTFTNYAARPLVTPVAVACEPNRGLRGRHIALWQSHGRYFKQEEDRWKWQRPQLWETCEDLYTQSYVLPFLVPMLENAGANVLLPRERDLQKVELIADNDPGIDLATDYAETSGVRPWRDGGRGFAHLRGIYHESQNPFVEGTVRKVGTITTGAVSTAVWSADVPEQGEYAVYVSYRSLPESADDALYTIRHLGGHTSFRVNQTMGGGTWIYLGTFRFAAGAESAVVTLCNRSSRAGRVVTADAVKIGGGMGNVARTVCDSLRKPGITYVERISNYPRFCEGVRYWLQWAGFPEEVYTPKNNKDDYRDDYMSRALWVNYLMGGSERLPEEAGLGIPVDMALAFHSDAGVRDGNETVGTLGIFCTKDNKGRFEGGADRYLSRDLTDLVMTQIVGDIRTTFEPQWMRRGMWNRAYYEARLPCAPTMLLELLSHQNFADMRYGSDPRFRFVVSRAVYKGVLRYLASQYDVDYVVQPLPVEAFSAELIGAEVCLRWQPVVDPMEPTAMPNAYIVYTRTDGGAFNEGRLVEGVSCMLPVEQGRHYSYRITAVNDGGESFPSETLSVCRMADARGCVLVVNGFDRVSAPLSIRQDSTAGFRRDLDAGAAYLSDISFIGHQRVFDCAMARVEPESIQLGACGDDYAAQVIGGNAFDYPAVHGVAIAAAGWSYCSASAKAVEQGSVPLRGYEVIDLILGKQRAVTTGSGSRGWEFRAFTPAMQETLRGFSQQGGALLVTGSYAVSDLCVGGAATDADRTFAREILRCESNGGVANGLGRMVYVPSQAGLSGGEYRFQTELCPEQYTVESPDVLLPTDEGFPLFCYAGSDRIAGVAWMGRGAARTVVVGVPFESLQGDARREALMRDLLRFLKSEQTL